MSCLSNQGSNIGESQRELDASKEKCQDNSCSLDLGNIRAKEQKSSGEMYFPPILAQMKYGMYFIILEIVHFF